MPDSDTQSLWMKTSVFEDKVGALSFRCFQKGEGVIMPQCRACRCKAISFQAVLYEILRLVQHDVLATSDVASVSTVRLVHHDVAHLRSRFFSVLQPTKALDNTVAPASPM